MRRHIVVSINAVQKLQSSCICTVCVQPSNSLPNCDHSDRCKSLRWITTYCGTGTRWSTTPSQRIVSQSWEERERNSALVHKTKFACLLACLGASSMSAHDTSCNIMDQPLRHKTRFAPFSSRHGSLENQDSAVVIVEPGKISNNFRQRLDRNTGSVASNKWQGLANMFYF